MNRGYFIHPTSIVDDNVEIGEGTKVWHFSHIQSGARIGKSKYVTWFWPLDVCMILVKPLNFSIPQFSQL